MQLGGVSSLVDVLQNFLAVGKLSVESNQVSSDQVSDKLYRSYSASGGT
jgi:hypothetical protein